MGDGSATELGLPGGSQPLTLVFHGRSGSKLAKIHQALSYGVVEMNVDTDTQYAFTRPIADYMFTDHMFTNHAGVLKIDGWVGSRKAYDLRSYLKLAEHSMVARVVQACENLRCAGRTLAPRCRPQHHGRRER
jgi:fructose-bisphosphate aldolase, class II